MSRRRPPSVPGAAWAVALAAALPLALAAACSRPAAAPGDTLVLLASRSFADSDRAAALLDGLAAATDILGPAHVEVVAAPQARPQDFARLLAERPADGRGLRAVIALLGDLSVLQDVDPSIQSRPPTTLSSRVVDGEALDDAVEQLERAAQAQGGRLVLASAPLGRQGRIEVRELLAVRARYQARPGFIDLQATFRPLEGEALFTNGIDRIGPEGQAVLARAVFAALCEDPGPIAPRDAAERRARAQARALARFAEGRRAEAAAELAVARGLAGGAAKADGPAAARATLREAALALALEGREAAAASLDTLRAAEPTPGLALLVRLVAEVADHPPAAEPFEAALVAVLDAVHARDPQSVRAAKALVTEHPERVEAWMLLELAGIVASPPTEVRDEARAQLARFPHAVVPAEVAGALLEDWPRCLDALPALYLAQQPFAEGDTGNARRP